MGVTSEEIKIMAAGGRCCITNGSGQYLAYGDNRQIKFVDEKTRAFVYDYVKDNVPIQLEQVRQAFKAEWYAEAV